MKIPSILPPAKSKDAAQHSPTSTTQPGNLVQPGTILRTGLLRIIQEQSICQASMEIPLTQYPPKHPTHTLCCPPNPKKTPAIRQKHPLHCP
ncbi:hypothetical protein BDV32DRAFT_125726 [Aspergillus pseudonomiae]|nr:hypothetical protein BDV32DRAFT_125726 [Aspergillus pseudonomiae]